MAVKMTLVTNLDVSGYYSASANKENNHYHKINCMTLNEVFLVDN